MFYILILMLYCIDAYNIKTSLMRHGLTKNNIQNIWTGELDVELESQDEIYKNEKFDLILSSNQKRCRQTVNNLLLDYVPDIMYDDGLNECGYGALTGMPKDYDEYKRDLFNAPPKSKLYKSESIFEGGLRAYLSYNKLINDYIELKSNINDLNVLIISHKNTMKGLWFFFNLENYVENLDEFQIDEADEYIKDSLKKYPLPEFENLKIYNYD